MGKALIDDSPLFRKVIFDCDQALAELGNGPSWSICEELGKEAHDSNIHKAEYSQPLCTALQLGLVALLDSWGLKPDAVVGHSYVSSQSFSSVQANRELFTRCSIVGAVYAGTDLIRRFSENGNADY